MTHLLRRSLALIPVLSLLSVLAISGTQAEAQVTKPFKIKGAGAGPNGLPVPPDFTPRAHFVIGEATHLGRHYGEGTVYTRTVDEIDFVNGKIYGTFASGSPFVFTGANGDKLSCDYGDQGGGELGDYVLNILGFTGGGELIVEALWIADFVARPGDSTGKFAGVTGSWVMYAYSDPFVLGSDDSVGYRWEGDGFLTFKKKK